MPTAPALSSSNKSALLCEVAWEVCNQLGGIHTVLKSKAAAMVNRWGDEYILIGPYHEENAQVEFEAHEPPADFKPIVQRLRTLGIDPHYGRWLIPGRPQVMLLDHKRTFSQLADQKYLLWKDNGINTESADAEVNNVISFGFAVYELLAQLEKVFPKRPKLAHVHEWMAGVVLPRIAHTGLSFATVFLTHATLLGRYVASHHHTFYRDLEQIDPEKAARDHGVLARFYIERAAAHSATVFTTISDVTAREAKHFLGRKPDYILPNGLNIKRFTALHEFQNLHLRYKEKIHEFIMGHFFPSYSFDLDRTLIIFTSGRYEYRNKGMDVFIESLYQLNQRLKELPEPPTVVAFIITKAWTKSPNVTALQNHSRLEELSALCDDIERGLGRKLLTTVAQSRMPQVDELIDEDLQTQLRQAMQAFKSRALPAIVTHDMVNDSEDVILNHLRHRKMFNDKNDRVKVVYHPDFLTHASPLLSLDYTQFVRGCHLGVFPSYYEPWGYTPPECLACGIPTVTTDLAGFGAFASEHIQEAAAHGVTVLRRSQQSPEQTIGDLTDYLVKFCQLSRRERIELRNRAERLSDHFEWNKLVAHYHDAHDEALRRRFG